MIGYYLLTCSQIYSSNVSNELGITNFVVDKGCVILHYSEYEFEVMQSFGAYKSFYVLLCKWKKKITNLEKTFQEIYLSSTCVIFYAISK